MTFLQLNYVIKTAETGSMNKAAEKLFVTQPTLTSAIRDLESEIGITIFNRTNKGIVITPEGEEFLSHAKQLLQNRDFVLNKYRQTQRRRKFAVSSQHYSFVDKAFVETVKKYDTHEFEFALRETKTREVILDVAGLKSEIGIIFLSEYNRRVITSMLAENGLEFHKLIDSSANVYLWKGHPLANRKSISFADLEPYPCLSFEQGPLSSSYMAEEILTEKEYPRLIHVTDRATNLNLMIGLNAYTLCSGIICEELNGSDFTTIPFEEDEDNQNSNMQIGYIRKIDFNLSEIGTTFIHEIQKYLNV